MNTGLAADGGVKGEHLLMRASRGAVVVVGVCAAVLQVLNKTLSRWKFNPTTKKVQADVEARRLARQAAAAKALADKEAALKLKFDSKEERLRRLVNKFSDEGKEAVRDTTSSEDHVVLPLLLLLLLLPSSLPVVTTTHATHATQYRRPHRSRSN